MIETRSQRVRVGDIELHVVTAGPESGQPVLLLHGFPDYWYGWRHQLDALVARGFRLIIPDQRGYGLSDKPTDIASYDIAQLARDVVGLLDAFQLPRASLVAHDFGGGVAWWVAAHHPERVDRMVVLNCPHFEVYRDAHKLGVQLARSWYVGTLVVPWLSERLCRFADHRLLVKLGPGTRVGGMRADDIPSYQQAWSRPGAVRGMLAWYRAMIPAMFRSFPTTRIAAPTRLLWGKQDAFLTHTMAAPSMSRCDHGELVMLDHATHWLHWDEPARVNALIGDWLAAAAPAG